MPIGCQRSRVTWLASTLPTSALIFSTIGRGTAAPVSRPNQSVDS